MANCGDPGNLLCTPLFVQPLKLANRSFRSLLPSCWAVSIICLIPRQRYLITTSFSAATRAPCLSFRGTGCVIFLIRSDPLLTRLYYDASSATEHSSHTSSRSSAARLFLPGRHLHDPNFTPENGASPWLQRPNTRETLAIQNFPTTGESVLLVSGSGRLDPLNQPQNDESRRARYLAGSCGLPKPFCPLP